MMRDTTTGCRVLVVEDEMFIAIDIEDTLNAMGCQVIGPFAKLDEALDCVAEEELDAAVLDVTIRGGLVYPVADKLLERGIPFVLASGYGDWALPANHRDRPRLTKPFTPAELERQVRYLCSENVEVN